MLLLRTSAVTAAIAALFGARCEAQTFQRLGACPTLGTFEHLPDPTCSLSLLLIVGARLRLPAGSVCDCSICVILRPSSILTWAHFRADFLGGQYFDIRLEVHAPQNGSQASGRSPDENFSFTIAKVGDDGVRSKAVNAAQYFESEEPELEKWSFSWYEGKLFIELTLFCVTPAKCGRPFCTRCRYAFACRCHC